MIIRAKAGMNPQVVEAWREDGLRLRSLRNQPRKVIHAKRPQRQRVALVVLWQVEEHARRLRLLIRWNRRTKEFCSLLPNLPAQRYHLEMISRAYTWRWQVEVLFKEWNSYAHLHAVDTTNPAIVEGLLWTAIAAAALKRFLAYRTQRLAEVPMSTRKVAMCAMHEEHSVILTPFEVAVDGVQIPDRRSRYTWRSEVPTSHCRCTRTTMPQSA